MRGAISLMLLGLAPGAFALDLPQARVQYTIEVRLDPATRGLSGRETIRWTNPTDTPVDSLRMHLYLNAFSHTHSTWLEEEGIDPGELEDLYRVADEPWGYLDPRSVAQVGDAYRRPLVWRPIRPDDGNPLDRTLIEVALAEPIEPRGSARIDIEFEGRLPLPIARTGARGEFFFLAQWYPKVGVLEPTGVRGAMSPRWAARQFHAETEFYADFADYDVTIVAPGDWIVGATGRRIGAPEPDGSGFSRHRYVQRAVHDFAAVAGGDLAERVYRRVAPDGGGPAVDIRHIVPRGTEHQIDRWQSALVEAMSEMGRRVGPYPYDTLTVVTPPFAAVGVAGMEYPTLFTGLLGDRLCDWVPGFRLPEVTVIHEFAHQYFYGLVASNEQEEAFLDEGFTQYWELSIADRLYGDGSDGDRLFGRAVDSIDSSSYSIEHSRSPIREPIRKMPTALYARGTWANQVYTRPALTLLTAERMFGRDVLDRVLAEYFRRYTFGHPGIEDFLRVADEAGGPEIGAWLGEGFSQPEIPDFAVKVAKAERYEPPVGRITTTHGVVTIGLDAGEDTAEAGSEPEGWDDGERVVVEITDPGWARNGASVIGTVRRVAFDPSRGEPDPGEGDSDVWYESTAVLDGPAWDHLPADVELRFADGTIVRDPWDGKAAWRKYRTVRRTPLTDVRIDRDGRILVDVVPQNNARTVEPDDRFVRSWDAWLAALAQWAAGSMAAWF